MSEHLSFGRKVFLFSKGEASCTEYSVTEKSTMDESEQHFTDRLLGKYSDREGTIEIFIKDGRPDYAIIKVTNEET